MRRRSRALKRAYGLTIDQADALLAGGCGICGKKAQHIDHDHNTGKVRGALCIPHNRALGTLGDTVESIKKVLNYLSQST